MCLLQIFHAFSVALKFPAHALDSQHITARAASTYPIIFLLEVSRGLGNCFLTRPTEQAEQFAFPYGQQLFARRSSSLRFSLL